MFNWDLLSGADYGVACNILGWPIYERKPDLVIAPAGSEHPYLYRWYVIPRNDYGNVYFHIQVASDPERPLHDHPWDNTSVILSGGYDEFYQSHRHIWSHAHKRQLHKGDVVHRAAEEAHRLILPAQFDYTMTLFTTGPRRRDWGFWFPDGWRNSDDVLKMENGASVMTEEARAQSAL